MKKYIPILIIAVILIAVALIVVYRAKLMQLFTGNNTEGAGSNGTAQPNGSTASAPAPLNYDLLLKLGSTGPEVKQLQKWLGITADGIFGNITKQALLDRKGTTQTTLNEFSILSDIGGVEEAPEADNYNSGGSQIFTWSWF